MSEVARDGGREGGVKARPILVYGRGREGGMEVNLVMLPRKEGMSASAP